MGSIARDFSSIVHSIELSVPHHYLSAQTIDYYKNNRYIRFENKVFAMDNGAKRSHLRVILPSLETSNIHSLMELSDYLRKIFSNIPDAYDSKNLLDALTKGRVRIIEVHIYKRLEKNDSLMDMFQTFKSNVLAFEMIIPHCSHVNVSNENSVYINLKNGKTIIIYDEMEKRSLDCLKLELRISHPKNLCPAFNIHDSDLLCNNHWRQLDVESLIRYLNVHVDKMLTALNIKSASKRSHKPTDSIMKLTRLLNIPHNGNESLNLEGLIDCLKDIDYARREKPSLLQNTGGDEGLGSFFSELIDEARDSNICRAIKRFHLTDLKIKGWLMKTDPELYGRIFYNELNNFFYTGDLSFVLAFIDFEIEFPVFTRTERAREALRQYKTQYSPISTTGLGMNDVKMLKQQTRMEVTKAERKLKISNQIQSIQKRHRRNYRKRYYIFDMFDPVVYDKEKMKNRIRSYYAQNLSYQGMFKDSIELLRLFKYVDS